MIADALSPVFLSCPSGSVSIEVCHGRLGYETKILRDRVSTVRQPILQGEISYALCHLPVQPCLKIVTSTSRALLILRGAHTITRTRLACYTRRCQAYDLHLVLVVIVSIVTAVDAVESALLQFNLVPSSKARRPVQSQLSAQQRGNACKTLVRTVKMGYKDIEMT